MRPKIPFVRPYFDYREQMYQQTIWHTRDLTEGAYTRQFEEMVARLSGREYGIAVNSGTTALYLLLKIRSFPTSLKWSITDYCFIAPHNAILATNGHYELLDIERDSLCAPLYSGPSVVVHYNNHKIKSCHYGKEHIHDIAHCIGTNFSDIEGDLAISFSAPKFVTTGQGGMVLTNDPKVRDEVINLKNHGRSCGKEACRGGYYNFKFSEIAAGYGIAQIEKLSQMQDMKRGLLDAYNKRIKLHNVPGELPWLFVYECAKSVELVKFLAENNIDAKRLYTPAHRELNLSDEHFPNTAWAYDNLVYLPSSVCMNTDDVNYVCDKIEEFNDLYNR